MIIKRQLLYLISFIEGSLLMIIEILVPKILAPYFGNSQLVWNNTIGLTLVGLTLGYYLGGLNSNKNNNLNSLLFLTIITFLLLLLLYFSNNYILEYFSGLNLGTGSFLAILILFFPLITLLGCFSPIIINLLSENCNNKGLIVGQIFSISTIGGVVFTFLSGFYLIPILGISFTSSIALFFSLLNIILIMILKTISKT